MARLVKTLSSVISSDYKTGLFSSAGAEAVETSMKIDQFRTIKYKLGSKGYFLCFHNSFYRKTLSLLSLSRFFTPLKI
ncbi:aminotransferase class III-fold pyridoxal phosphate-dependent enzyme [Candidatus Coxiella mudrowiae]|uniref:aminotransferase class III-fold pyridoxal phosphate-dependent enzyme n=1 Tax=Candidatus Coxiella mudrowiae TaxID=2054173 RepID=UPI000C2881F9|nr:aminotransferase class III-fold pyridoxal phosphate-dependent enzyme [Candidatus Coxiella mudrowiae]